MKTEAQIRMMLRYYESSGALQEEAEWAKSILKWVLGEGPRPATKVPSVSTDASN